MLRAAQHIVGQYYQLLRLGCLGYTRIMHGCAAVAEHLTDGIEATGAFTILSVRALPALPDAGRCCQACLSADASMPSGDGACA